MRLTPLLVLAALSAPLQAQVDAPPRERPPERADAPPGERPLGYPELFAKGVRDAERAFASGLPLPEVREPRTPEEKQRYGRQFDNFETLIAQAGYIQSGRGPQDDPDTWNAMVLQVAGKLNLDSETALKLYGSLRRPGTGPGGEGDTAEAGLRAGLIAEVLENPQLRVSSHRDLAQKLERTRRRLMTDLMDDGSAAAPAAARADRIIARRTTYGDARDLGNIPPQVRPLSFKPADVPPTENGGFAGKVLAFLDTQRAHELADAVARRASGFRGRCYAFVKAGLKKILPSGWYGWLYEDQGSAYKFTENLRENPKMLDKLKLRKLSAEDIPDGVPPVGSIIVYGRGVCGFNPRHGHIEVSVGGDPPRYCSDGCTRDDRHRCIKANLGVKDRVNVYVPVTDEALARN